MTASGMAAMASKRRCCATVATGGCAGSSLNLTVLFALICVCLSCGDQTNGVTVLAPNRVNDRQQCRADPSHSFPAIFTIALPTIKCLDSTRVQKHLSRILKIRTMFALIRLGILAIPLKFHDVGLLRL